MWLVMPRYLVIEYYPEEINFDDVYSEFIKSIKLIAGYRYILGSVRLVAKKDNRFLVRVNTKLYPYVRAAIAITRRVKYQNVTLITITCSGTLRKALSRFFSIPKLIT